jgi:hypothetical protein
MESPDDASEMACPMVLQAVCGVLQSLSSLPFTPSTYHVLLAMATGATASLLGEGGICGTQTPIWQHASNFVSFSRV